MKNTPWYSGLQRLVGSSKAWVVLAAIVGIVVMNVTGRIEGTQALEAITWVVAVWLGAVAIEDGAHKMQGGGNKKLSAGGQAETLARIMQLFTPLLSKLFESEPEKTPEPDFPVAKPAEPVDTDPIPVTVDKEG